MEFDRSPPLRIRDVYVAHGCCDHCVAQDALHLGQVNTRFEQIGRAAVTKLMKTVQWGLGAARDSMHTVAYSER